MGSCSLLWCTFVRGPHSTAQYYFPGDVCIPESHATGGHGAEANIELKTVEGIVVGEAEAMQH